MKGRYTVLFFPVILILLYLFISWQIGFQNTENHFTNVELLQCDDKDPNRFICNNFWVFRSCNSGGCKYNSIKRNGYSNRISPQCKKGWEHYTNDQNTRPIGAILNNTIWGIIHIVLIMLIFFFWVGNDSDTFIYLDRKFNIDIK